MIESYLMETVLLLYRTLDGFSHLEENRVKVPARIEWKTRYVKNERGEEVVSKGNFLMSERTLDSDTMAEIDGTKYPIITVDRPKDFDFNVLRVYL